MALHNLVRRASSLLGLSAQEAANVHCKATEDGEVIYCKNNVCVHPPMPMRTGAEHHPGYLTIRTQQDESIGSTLILSWVPNSSLRKNPRSLENRTPTHSPCRSTRSSACPSPRRSPRHSLPSIHSSITSPHLISCSSEKSVDELLDGFLPRPPKGWDACSSGSVNDDATDLTAKNKRNAMALCSPDDAAIEPAQVTEALEAMISGLNAIGAPSSPTAQCFKEVSDEEELEEQKKKERRKDVTTFDIRMTGDSVIIRTDIVRKQETALEDSKPLPPVANGTGGRPTSVTSAPAPPLSSPRKNDLKLKLIGGESNSNGTVEEKAASGPPRCTPVPKVQLDLSVESNGTGVASTAVSSAFKCDPDSVSLSPSSELDSCSFLDYEAHPCMSLPAYYIEDTPEALAMVRKLNFPDQCSTQPNTPSPSRKFHSCSFFSVDLGQMKSLRLFFSNKECTCGQLVIANRESQYKILHFHHGGLEKLAAVFEEWDFFIKPKTKGDNCPYRQFSISRPEVSKEECHPEEGQFGVIGEEEWRSYLNDEGQIEEDFHLRKAIFFGGLESTIRHEVWPFLLYYYPFVSTVDEREQIRNDRYLEYQAICKKRETLSDEEREIFWRNIQCTVDKDVVRTDRSNPFFAGDDNPNLEVMRNILLNYAIYNPAMGYTQGMSDLLAPILAEVQVEADTFWCFVGLMQRTLFISSPKDNDMDRHLNFSRELIRLMVPKFYEHLLLNIDAMELLFCHRWILLCFKREFSDYDALRMWEACWAHYQTDYFHLFICVAIIAIYSEDVIQQGMTSDEMLLYFSSLAMHMNGDLVLRKARGLLYQFRQMPQIPCTLQGLCEMCGPGMWDSGHAPVIECVGHEGLVSCPNAGECPSL